ncbi:MAG: hypothetical protein IPK19_00560 [Chloroflexi bacterium]|nr:hypothetical protein [Chloroflexota bacterium]
MPQTALLQDEINILYVASNKLTQASTPIEQLEAVSDYARSHRANRGVLLYCDFDPAGEDGHGVRIEEVVAEWTMGDAQPIGLGARFRHLQAHMFAGDTPRDSQHVTPKPLFFHNAQEDALADAGARALNQRYGIYGCVYLSLFNKGRWVAAITFGWDEPHSFDARDERIYTALQQQVAPVVDSVRLFEQTQKRADELERLNQEINLLYRASEILQRAETYAEVVEGIAQFDLEADVVTLMLWEGFDWETADYLEVVAVIDRIGGGVIQPGARLPKANFPVARHMIGERVWLFEDALTDPRIDPVTGESWKMLGIRSFMGPAFYAGDRWIGGITFQSARPRKYSQREARLFAGIGDVALAAIDRIRLRIESEASQQQAEALARANTDLLEQAQRRARELEMVNREIDQLYRVGESINAANSYDELVQAVSGIISGDTAVALYFWEGWDSETASYVEQIAATGYMVPENGRRIPKEALPYTKSVPRDRLLILEDITADPRLDEVSVASFAASDFLAAISIRLFVKQRWIGALLFHSKVPRPFSTRERRLALGVGDYVRGAVERIRLQQETEAARRAAESVAEQAQRLASLEERTRLARELHDSVSQVLYGIGLGARTARTLLTQNPARLHEPLDYILSLAEAGLTEMRALIFELRPESLAEEGLVSTLSKQVASLKARYGVEAETAFCEEPQLPLETKEGLYRIAREALHNTIKHAQATHVRLTLEATGTGYQLEIADNGHGFDPNQSFPGHLGLKSMRERTASLNGVLCIDSAPGTGTRVVIAV